MTELYHVEQLLLFPAKECTSCHIEKPLEEFYKQSPKRGGYQAWCKVCGNEKRRLKRLQNIQNPPEREPLTSLVCKQCANEKTIDNFYADPLSARGYRATCKDCVDSVDKRKKNPGKYRNRRGIPTTSGHKWCFGCESEQPFSNFLEDPTKRDGYRTKCNDCYKIQRHGFWQENRDRLLPEQRIRLRDLYNTNLEYFRTYNREKNRKPRYHLIATSVRNRRRAQMIATLVEEVDFRQIIKRDGYHCYICNQAINPDIISGPARLSFDHVIPLAKNGTHTEDNIKPTHLVCNQRKNRSFFNEMDVFQRRGPDA